MRKLMSIGCTLLVMVVSHAQLLRVPAGKKIQILTTNTISATLTMMGQAVDIGSTSSATMAYVLKTITDSAYTVSCAITRITGTISILGQAQQFDSDSDSTRTIPEMAEILKQLNKPQDITVKNGVAGYSNEITNPLVPMAEDHSFSVTKLFLTVAPAKIKQGYSWSDSSVSENAKTVNQYIITKTDSGRVELMVNTDSRIRATVKQAGMELKEDMTGFSTGTRVYDRATGVLISERIELAMAGTAQMMGMDLPLVLKSVTLSAVK